MVFDDVLKTIENEQEAAAIRTALEKNPATKKALEEIEARVKNGDMYLDWYKGEWPKFQDAPQLRSQLAAAQSTIQKLGDELKGKASPVTPLEEINMEEMTTEQFTARVDKAVQDMIKAQGLVTTSEAQRMADEAAVKAAGAAESRVYTHGLPAAERMIMLARKYESDFKSDDGTPKPFPRMDFGAFIEKNRIPDVDRAYEEFTRQDYLNKAKADAFAQGELKGSRETEQRLTKEAAENAARSLPVDMTGSAALPVAPGVAPAPLELDKIPEDYQLGRKGGFRLAAAVAEKVKQDRAAGKTI